MQTKKLKKAKTPKSVRAALTLLAIVGIFYAGYKFKESQYQMPIFLTPSPAAIEIPAPTATPESTSNQVKASVRPTSVPKAVEKPIEPVSNDNLIVLINQKRAEANVQQLSPNALLMKSAQAKANDMCKRNYWSHETPEGKEFFTWIKEAGYIYKTSGENLAKDCGDGRCMDLWMNSPIHKEVMLDPDYRDIGVGRCGTYKVTHFGSR